MYIDEFHTTLIHIKYYKYPEHPTVNCIKKQYRSFVCKPYYNIKYVLVILSYWKLRICIRILKTFHDLYDEYYELLRYVSKYDF